MTPFWLVANLWVVRLFLEGIETTRIPKKKTLHECKIMFSCYIVILLLSLTGVQLVAEYSGR